MPMTSQPRLRSTLRDLAEKDIRFTKWSLQIDRTSLEDIQPKFQPTGDMKLFYRIELKPEDGETIVSVHARST